ncbi:MAG: phosphoribosylformylglycinamidine synthase subunit PurS [Actinobacteria bacterium]|nr:phosphoribosylformylglycinamidine synthase subunit PurS [Actinomycetota bacterium]
MKVTVVINRRPEIADPEGTTVRRALHELGFTEVAEVRMDRVIHLDVDDDDQDRVRDRVDVMCSRLLANPVLEDYLVVLG